MFHQEPNIFDAAAIAALEAVSSTLSDYLKDICVRHDVQCKSLVI